MTFLKFHSKGCMVAHIGDSRIYHIRPSASGEDRIRYVSYDHSLINDLVASGQMTPEEAKNSNQKNVITRAMQPGLNPRPKADVYNIEDIRPGDCFYMCTDGMLERMDDMELADILSEPGSVEAKLQEIVSRTAENRDNHTAHLIEVEDVINDQPMPVAHSRSSRNMIFVVSVAVAAVIAGFLLFSGNDSKKPKAAKEPDVSQQEVVSPEPEDPSNVTEIPQGPDSGATLEQYGGPTEPAEELEPMEPKEESDTNPYDEVENEGPDIVIEEPKISFDKNKGVLKIGEDEFNFAYNSENRCYMSKELITGKVFKQIMGNGKKGDNDTIFRKNDIQKFVDVLNGMCKDKFEITIGYVRDEKETNPEYAKYNLKFN